MNGLFKIFIGIAIACMVSSCAQPIGSIGGDSGKGSDELKAVPKKVTYNLTEIFIRDYDLSVFAARHSILYNIPVKDVSIYVIDDPDNPEESKELVPLDPEEEPYMFRTIGHKYIRVEYKTLADTYKVEVDDPFNYGSVPGSGAGQGIEVIWGF